MYQRDGHSTDRRHRFRLRVHIFSALFASPCRVNVAVFASLLALVAACPLPAQSGTQEGVAAFEAENYERAFRELKPAAEAGDAEAQYYLGSLSYRGSGIAQDITAARKWFELGARQGYAPAQASLAYILERGTDVAADQERAADLYRQAGNQGHVIAQRNLGLMHKEGEGVERDYEAAATWFRRAAEQGDGRSAREIGEIFYYGRGGYPLDYEEAIRWYCRGAHLDDGGSQYALYGLYLQGLGVTSDTVTAFTWAAFAADQGYPGGEQAWSRADSHISSERRERIRERVSADDKPDQYCQN